MKTLIICISFIFGWMNVSHSQNSSYEKPDYEQIKTEIQDSSSVFYYPQLLKRFEVADTYLTDEEFRYLYYGYLFQKEYKPYLVLPEEKELNTYLGSSELKEEDYDKIISLLASALSKSPFDLRKMNFLAYIYHLKNDNIMEIRTAYKFDGIMRTILSSGDGKTCETGYHVISVSNEYAVLDFLKAEIRRQYFKNGCDNFKVKNEDDIYFDVRQFFGKGF
jgi:hypothetical protein